MLQECPPGLNESSFAFRYAGFGTHELVEYYELVRELLWSCWESLEALRQSPQGADRLEVMTAGDFLATEIARLEGVRDAWLDTPDPECHMRTPRSIIDRERARLPEGLSGREAMIDPDCPCCQMLSDLPGPTFWHLDGCNMDDEFAFDIYRRTRADWDQEQREREEFDRRFEAEWSERERLGVAARESGEEGAPSVWSRSFTVDETADVPLGVRVFNIGCHLAEIIADLRDGADRESTPPEVQQTIDRLNRDFGNLRELLQTAEPSLAAALIDPVRDRFADSLAAIAAAHPGLAAKCDALENEVAHLLDEPPPEPDWDAEGMDDVPF